MSFTKETSYNSTPIGDVPSDWKVVTLEQITTSHKQGFYTSDSYSEKGVRLARITDLLDPKMCYETMPFLDVDNSTYEQFKVAVGDFLFARSGAIGRHGIVTEDIPCIFAAYIIRFRFEETLVNNYFLSYLFQADFVKNQFLSKMHGATNININAENIKSIRIPLPSLHEQLSIVGILGVVDSAIELADQVIAKTERLKKGLMQQLLTHGIGHTEYKSNTKLGSEVPKEWNVIKFDEANERIFVGIATSSTKYFASNGQGVPLIRNQNIKETGVDVSDLIYITKDFADANKSKALRENDIVIVRTGVPGLSSRVTKEMEGWQTFTTLISRPRLSEFYPDFLVYVLNSPVCKNQIARLQAGLAQQNLNVGAIVNLYVPKPPRAEQIQIAERIRTIYEKQHIENESLERLKRIKQGLMDLLLTGKVRIKVD